ncbi:MAG: UDP-glucuronic acid decarboxylase family protein [Planctomycetota bacterium]
MRAVVTGGAGFLGSHLVDALLARGHAVVAVDNFLTGTPRNLEHLSGEKRFALISGNVTEFIAVDGAVDAVLHFASPASPRDYGQFPIQTLKVGALGTHRALGLAKAKRARFLMASTSEVYGDPKIHPQPETYWGNVNPIGPRGVYDEAKRFAEAMVMAYHRVHALDTRIVRIFNTYGPRMRPDDGRALPNFINQALRGEPLTVYGDGGQTRSFCYVADTAEGIVRLLLAEPSAPDAPVEEDVHFPVNIGNPSEMTVLAMAKEVLAQVRAGGPGRTSRIVFEPLPVDDPHVRQPDITRARHLLAWEPKVPLAKGLETTIAYFRSLL